MNQDRESFGDSLHHLAEDLGSLFRAELTLFKKELSAQFSGLASAGVWVAGGAVMGLAFLGAFTALLIMALSLAMAPWLAALVVTAIYGFAAAALIAAAMAKLRETLPLDFNKTTSSVKEDVEWIKSGMKSAK
ncbi:MAG: phage holin family protein [Candidatus Baltobacteraceae bacterium]